MSTRAIDITKEDLEKGGLKASLARHRAEALHYAEQNPDEAARIHQALEVRRHPDTIVGTVMSNAEVNDQLRQAQAFPNKYLMIAGGVAVFTNKRVLDSSHKDAVFFLTDDYCYGGQLLRNAGFWSSLIHMGGVTRTGMPMNTAEDLIAVYCQGERQLSTVDELLNFLNNEA